MKSIRPLRYTVLAALTILLAIIFSFGAAEVVLRVLRREMSSVAAAYYFKREGSLYDFGHEPLNVRLKPSAISTIETPEYRVQTFVNSLGFNDYEVTIEKPSDVFRIVVVGDSITFGSGVDTDQTFPKYLERRFAAEPLLRDKRVQVINLGCGSWSAGQLYLAIRHLALPLAPDLVVFVHYANDAMEWPFYPDAAGLPRTYVVAPEYWNAQRPPLPPAPVPVTRVPRWLEEAARISDVMSLAADAVRNWSDEQSRLGTSEYRLGDEQLDPFWPLRRGANLDQSRSWQLHETIFLAASEATRAAGVEFLAVFAPVGAQVNGYEWDLGRTLHAFPRGHVAPYEMQDRLLALAGRAGIRTVNLLPVLQDRSRPQQRIYFPYDGHLTPFGHQVVAGAIEQPLREILAGPR